MTGRKHTVSYKSSSYLLITILVLLSSFHTLSQKSTKTDRRHTTDKEYAAKSRRFEEQNKNAEALENIILAIKYSKRTKDISNLRDYYFRKGSIEIKTNHNEAAILTLEQAAKMPMHESNFGLGCIYNTLGQAYLNIGKTQEAKKYFIISIQPDKLCQDTQAALMNLGVIHLFANEPDSALFYLNQVTEAKNHSIGFNGVQQLNMAYAYLLKENYNKAGEYYDSSYISLRKANDMSALASYYLDKSEFYELQGQYKNALKMINRHHEIKDSLFNQSDEIEFGIWERKLGKKEERLRLQKQKNKILSLNSEKKTSRLFTWVFSVISLALLVISISTYLLYKNRLKNRKILYENKTSIQQQKAKILQLNLENESLAKETLRKEMSFKQKDMIALIFEFKRKKELIEQVVSMLETFSLKKRTKKMSTVMKSLKEEVQKDQKKDLFAENLDIINQEFFSKLQDMAPSLTKNDLDLCSFYRTGLTSKEIASIRFTEVSSVRMARYRLRKKLLLPADTDLYMFLQSM